MIDPELLKYSIQAQMKAIQSNDFKTFDLIQKEKLENKPWLKSYLGIVDNADSLNKEYEGKGLDQSAYLEFWEDFSLEEKKPAKRKGSVQARSSLASTGTEEQKLPSIGNRRSSVPIVEDTMFANQNSKLQKVAEKPAPADEAPNVSTAAP
jgi:hypothetical protein